MTYDNLPPWPENVAGRAIQLTAAAFTSVANNDAFNWCGAGVPYGSWAGPDGNVPQLGTPGTANGTCGLLGSAGSTSGGETVLSPPPASGGNGGSGGSGNGGAASGKAGASGTGAAGSPAGDGYPLTGELVITELMIHPTASADTGEWFEVYNPTGKSFDLRGIQIVSNASAHVIAGSQPIVASPGAYVVFAHSESSVANGGLPASVFAYPAQIGLTDDLADGLALRVLDDEGNIVRTIDEASYAGTKLGRWTGASRSLAPGSLDAVQNDAEAAWCPATSTYGVAVPKDRGTPGKANDPCDPGGAGGQDAGGTGGSDGEGGAGGSDSEGGTAGASGSKAGNGGASAQGGNASKGGNAGKGGSPAKGGAGGDEGEGGGGSAPAGGAANGKGGKGGGATASKGGASAVGGGAASAQGGASGELALTNGGDEGCGCRIAGAPDPRGPADGLLAASFPAASALLLRERRRRRA